MSIIDEAMSRASKSVNSVLGDSCEYHHESGEVTGDVFIIIDRNKKVHDDHGFIAGYRVEAAILKSDIPEICNDEFVDPSGRKWSVGQITQETSSKWYVDISLIEV